MLIKVIDVAVAYKVEGSSFHDQVFALLFANFVHLVEPLLLVVLEFAGVVIQVSVL